MENLWHSFVVLKRIGVAVFYIAILICYIMAWIVFLYLKIRKAFPRAPLKDREIAKSLKKRSIHYGSVK